MVFSLVGLQLPTLIRDLSHSEAWPAEALAVAGTLIVTITAPLMTRSTGPGRACRSGSSAPAPGSTATSTDVAGLADRRPRCQAVARTNCAAVAGGDPGHCAAIAEQVRIIVADAKREVAQPADLDFTHAEAESMLRAVAGHPTR